METLPYGNMKIFRKEGHREAVVFAHGSYKPSGLFDKGTELVLVPPTLTVRFYAALNNVGVGSSGRINEALTGQSRAARETAAPGSRVVNYGLSHAKRSTITFKYSVWVVARATRDLIIVRSVKSATLDDVFDAIFFYKLPYTVLHNYHCRVTEDQADQIDAQFGDD